MKKQENLKIVERLLSKIENLRILDFRAIKANDIVNENVDLKTLKEILENLYSYVIKAMNEEEKTNLKDHAKKSEEGLIEKFKMKPERGGFKIRELSKFQNRRNKVKYS